MKIKRALISVSDKTGLDFLVKELVRMGVEIISTGGTRKYIESLGFKVMDIAEFTGFPEILDGRVKTLHPKVHGAVLAKRNNECHVKEALEHKIKFIDMVVVNLYPFIELSKKTNISHSEMIENIDIGGPSMLRSSAKGYEHVVVVCNPKDYQMVIQEIKKEDGISLETRANLAAKVFVQTSIYDNFIHNYLVKKNTVNNESEHLPNEINKKLVKDFDLRYGENPHQKAGYYTDDDDSSGIVWQQLGGKELSYNNLLDMEAAWNIVNDFKNTTAVIVKHNNPCGVGKADVLLDAYLKALSTDPLSAFGGIVAMNVPVDKNTAVEINKLFTECIIAPDYADDALELLLTKKNVRVVKINKCSTKMLEYKRVFTGFLVQEKDIQIANEKKLVTTKSPTEREFSDLDFAWIVCKHVKSNAIVLAKDGVIIGIGAGQMSRVDSVEIAISKAQKAGFDLSGAVIASDAYFPFKDSIEKIADYGITAVIQPGGSIRDTEVIDCCNSKNISMVFTGQRHFRH
jgi:phosphoribosylaminoimidazolecarboxamide formyltransferase/IMP cyclohydrolase